MSEEKKHYMTLEGKQKLENELEQLKTEKEKKL